MGGDAREPRTRAAGAGSADAGDGRDAVSVADRIRRYWQWFVGSPRAGPLLLGLVAGVTTYLLAITVFPYHTINHDEAVYLQQAELLLEGQLALFPPVPEAFHPWFFVDDGGRLYPKYAPVPAAMFALGKLAGGFRLALAAASAGVVALATVTVRESFGRPHGVVAGVVFLVSPLFLVQSAVFLPYLPTTLLTLAFAAAYLRADRTGSVRWAAVAGGAIGLAFFSRPYTAVLFATPFCCHAGWTLWRDRTTLQRREVPAVLRRQVVTALGGLVGVGLTLWYNATMTGDPLLFPYEAFAPLDGLGFGRRRILGYSIDYTPALALRANAEVVRVLLSRWFAGGPLGTAFATVGGVLVVRRWRADGPSRAEDEAVASSPGTIGGQRADVDDQRARQATVLGILPAVVLGNVYFWGNRNLLGQLDRPGDGLIHFLGPYYHVDALLPLSALVAVAIVAVGRSVVVPLVREPPELPRVSVDRALRRRLILASLLVAALAGGAVVAGMAAAPLGDNAAITDRYERAYAPVEAMDDRNALVFLPTPYGDWLGHPFQPLRNDPGYDEGSVYALRERQFDVVDAFPDRTYYRYEYRGEWAPAAGQRVDATVDRVDHVGGRRISHEVTLGLPDYAERVSISVATDDDRAVLTAPAGDSLTVRSRIDARNGASADEATAHVVIRSGSAAEPSDPFTNASLAVEGRDELVITALLDDGTGSGSTYRIALPLRVADGEVRALSSVDELCHAPPRCGGEAAIVPGEHASWVEADTSLRAVGESGDATVQRMGGGAT